MQQRRRQYGVAGEGDPRGRAVEVEDGAQQQHRVWHRGGGRARLAACTTGLTATTSACAARAELSTVAVVVVVVQGGAASYRPRVV